MSEQTYNGVILEEIGIDTPRFGGVNGIAKELLMPTKDWSDWSSRDELQAGVYFDSWACVNFSANNDVEHVLNFKIAKDMISPVTLQFLDRGGFFDDLNRVNLSDRYSAKVSGTVYKKGNSGGKVGESMKVDGIVSEPQWSFPNKQRYPIFDEEDYFKELPESVKNSAQEFYKHFGIDYEVVYKNDFDEALKYGPIQVYVIAWYKDGNVYYSPPDKRQNHAALYIKKTIIRDSYDPFLKTLTEDYNYYYIGIQYYVTNKIKDISMELKENNLYKLVEGPIGRLGVAVNHNGKLVLATHKEDDMNKFNIFMEAIARDTSPIEERTISVNMADWNSADHYNLKLQELDDNYDIKQPK